MQAFRFITHFPPCFGANVFDKKKLLADFIEDAQDKKVRWMGEGGGRHFEGFHNGLEWPALHNEWQEAEQKA